MNELRTVADTAERVGASSNWVLLELKVQGKGQEGQEIQRGRQSGDGQPLVPW